MERVRTQAPPGDAKQPEPTTDDAGSSSGIVININPEWRLSWDGLQFHLERWVVRKQGKTAGLGLWANRGYFSSLDSAIIALAARRIYAIEGAYEAEALVPLCRALDEIKADCKRACANMILALKDDQRTRPDQDDAAEPQRRRVGRGRKARKGLPLKQG